MTPRHPAPGRPPRCPRSPRWRARTSVKSAWNTTIITSGERQRAADAMGQHGVDAIGPAAAERTRRAAHLGHQAIDELIAAGDDLEIEVAAGLGGALVDAADGGIATEGGNARQLVGAVVVERQQQPLRPGAGIRAAAPSGARRGSGPRARRRRPAAPADRATSGSARDVVPCDGRRPARRAGRRCPSPCWRPSARRGRRSAPRAARRRCRCRRAAPRRSC